MTSYLNPSTRSGGVEQIVVPERQSAVPVDDAPFDDEQYVRVKGEWVPYEAPPIIPDTLAPKPPTGLGATGTMASNGTRVDYELGWDAPTQNVDDSPLDDFAYYVVRWRYASGGVYQMFTTKDTSFLLPSLRPAVDVVWSVLARDFSGNDSAWADHTITGLADSTAPNQPSLPQLATRLGAVIVGWDGLDFSAGAPPSDFDHLEGYMSATTGGPWEPIGRLGSAGLLFVAGIPVGETRFFTFIAYDTSGNPSTRSGESSIEVLGVTGPDIEANAITANMITSGEITAVLALIGALTVGGVSGARLELNPSQGFTLYNPDNSPAVSFPLDGSGNLFDGDIIARGLTTLGRASFRGVDNEISRDSAFIMASGTTPPASGPTVAVATPWLVTAAVATSNVAITKDETTAGAGLTWDRYGASATSDGASIARVCIDHPAVGDPTKMRVEVMDRVAGTAVMSPQLVLPTGMDRLVTGGIFTDQNKYRVFKVGTEWWVLGQFRAGVTTAVTRVIRYSAAWAKTGEFAWAPAASEANAPMGATDGVNFWIGVQYMGGWMNLRRYSNAGAVLETVASGQIAPSDTSSGLGLCPVIGNFDFGSKRFIVSQVGVFNSSDGVYTLNAAGAVQASEKLTDSQAYLATDLAYWGGKIRAVDWKIPVGGDGLASPTVTTEVLKVLTLPSRTVQTTYYAKSTWYDSDPGGTGTHETTTSPLTTKAIRARDGLQITTAPPADAGDVDSPDSARLYLGTTSADLHLVGTYVPSAGPTVIWDVVLTGAVPPVANSFPDGNAGMLASAIGGFMVKGDGTGAWPYLRTQWQGDISTESADIRSDLTTDIGTAKTDAINTAASDATNKVDTFKNDLVNNSVYSFFQLRLGDTAVSTQRLFRNFKKATSGTNYYEYREYLFDGGTIAGKATGIYENNVAVAQFLMRPSGQFDVQGQGVNAGKGDLAVEGDSIGRGAQPGAAGYAQIVASTAGVTTQTDVPGLSVTVTVPAGRRIKVTLQAQINSTVANDRPRLTIREGTTDLQTFPGDPVVTAGAGNFLMGSAVLTPTAGTHTYKATILRGSGSGSVNVVANASGPAFILVEDIGAA